MAMPYVQDGVFRVYVKGNAAQLGRAVAGLRLCTVRSLAGLRKWEKQAMAPSPGPQGPGVTCSLHRGG